MATTPSEKAAIFREAAEMVNSSSWAEQQLMYAAAKLGDEKAVEWCHEYGWYEAHVALEVSGNAVESAQPGDEDGL